MKDGVVNVVPVVDEARDGERGVLVSEAPALQLARAQEAAKASLLEAARLREMFDSAPVGVFRVGSNGELEYVNAAGAELFGSSGPAAMQREVGQLDRLFASEQAREAVVRHLEDPGGQLQCDVELRRLDGRPFVGALRARVIRDAGGRFAAWEGFLTDVTEQRRVEAAGHRAAVDEARLRGLSSRSNEIELVVALDGHIIEANDRATEAYGYARAELLSLHISALRAPSTIGQLGAQMERAAGAEGVRFESEHRRRDGSVFPVQVSSRGFEVGGRTYLHSLIRDLTEARKVEHALHESERRLRLALGASHRVEWELDVAKDRRIVGPEWQAVTGRTSEEGLDAAQWSSLIHPEDRDAVQRALDECLEGRVPEYDVEYRVAQPGGGWRRLLSQAHVTASQGGRPLRLVGTLGDVTELRELQGRAARAERVASLATLSSGMAHEINNPLAVVIANLGWAAEELARSAGAAGLEQVAHVKEDVRQALLEASDEARRVGEIIGRLRLFAGGGIVSTAGRARVTSAVDEAMRLVASELTRCKAVEVSVPGELEVAMSELALVQLLANVLKNAAQATGHRPNRVRVTARPEGPGQISVVISDEGVGMGAHALAHAFDPFFSTKAIGREIGLGLPVCLGLAQAVGGDVRLESMPEGGTTVTVVLPIAGSPVPARP